MTENLPKKAPVQTGKSVSALVPQNLDEYWRVSVALSKAGDMVPKDFRQNPEMIMAAIMRGGEIGLAPMQALSNIAVINGRASIWGDALPAVVQRAGHHIDVEVTGDGKDAVATATLERGDTGKKITRTFSIKDAEAAGLLNKPGPWKQYPKRMLMHRARAWAVRDGAADALMGLSVIEEMQDVGPEKARDVTPKRTATEDRLMRLAKGEPEKEPDDVQVEGDVIIGLDDAEPDRVQEAKALSEAEILAEIEAEQRRQAEMFEGDK